MLATMLPTLTKAAEREKGAHAYRQDEKSPREGGPEGDRGQQGGQQHPSQGGVDHAKRSP